MADKARKTMFSTSPKEDFNPLDDDAFLQIPLSDDDDAESGESPLSSIDQDSLPSLEARDLERYAVTPPTNFRAVKRGKEKNRSTKIKQSQQLEKERLKVIRAQKQRSAKADSMSTERLGDVICSIDGLSSSPSEFDPGSSMTAEMMGGVKKKKDTSKPFKTSRSIDRDMKMSSGDLSSLDLSLPAQVHLKVDMPNRFQSLRSKLVPSVPPVDLDADHTYLQRRVTSYSSLECPQDRIEFYKTFSILVNLGNSTEKKKKDDLPYTRQMSSEQELWQSQLSDIIWLDIQAWFHQRSLNEQDGHLMKAREIVPNVLEEIMNFKVRLKTPDEDPTKAPLQTIQEDKIQSENVSVPLHEESNSNSDERLYSQVLVSSQNSLHVPVTSPHNSFVNLKSDPSLSTIVANQKEALQQVTELLDKLEKIEKLYPTLKAVGNDHLIYSSEVFQNRLNTLCLWSNITKDIGNKLSLMATVLYVDNIPGLDWPLFDSESPGQLLNQIRDTSEAITPDDCTNQYDGLSSDKAENNDGIINDGLSDTDNKPDEADQTFNDGLSSDGSEGHDVGENVHEGLSIDTGSKPNDTNQTFNDGLNSDGSEGDSEKVHEGLSMDTDNKPNETVQTFNDGLSSDGSEGDSEKFHEGLSMDTDNKPDKKVQTFNDGLSSDCSEGNDLGGKLHDGLSSSDSESEPQIQIEVKEAHSSGNSTGSNGDSTPKCNKNVRFYGLDLNSPDTSPIESSVNLLACSPPDSSTPKRFQHFPNRQVSNTSTLSRTSSSMSYEESRTGIYRHFVDRHLKKMGLRKLLHRLKCLLDGSLQRARHALEKPRRIVKSQSLDMVITERLSPEMEVLGTSPSLDGNPGHEEMACPERRESLISYGCYSTDFQNMNLPPFKDTYLFLVRIPLDVVHECLRLRLEQRPEADPSLLSVKQLIRECKEVLLGAVMVKQYYLSMVNHSVLDEHDRNDGDMEHFEEDLKHMLEVYFDYLQTWMSGLQRTYEVSKKLKNFLEDEWKFIKNVCPHVIGGEANAGRRFCLMASSLLRSIADFLEFGMDECVNQLYDSTLMESEQEMETNMRRHSRSNEIRHAIIQSCRGFKETFHEARERASKALGFAKMLRKDLEIAADFNVQVTAVELLDKLNQTNHVRVITSYSSGYLIFVPHQIKHDQQQILQLLNITCGRDDLNGDAADEKHGGYLILLKCESCLDHQRECPKWKGPQIKVEPNADTTIALSHIEVQSLLFVVVHSSQLGYMRREFEKLMESSVLMVSEQTSCHRVIAESLRELRTAAMELRDHVSEAICQVDEKLSIEDVADLEETEKVNIQKLYRETLHQCYSFGFEYHRELVRLVSGDMREALSLKLVLFARQWMAFVTTKCERGRGVKPRWAKPGLDFLIVACEPRITRFITKTEFSELKSTINVCIMHLIGDKATHHTSPGSRVGSPLPDSRKQMMNRNMSCPEGARTPTRSLSTRSVVSDQGTPSDRTTEFLRKNSLPASAYGKPDIDVELTEGEEGGIFLDIHPHLDPLLDNIGESRRVKTIRKAVQNLEQQRTNTLYKIKQIGRMTLQQREVDYHITNKKVNFKWQRGIKIGEGQYGKVYTAVNMDSGVLMAIKEIRFQPNDYQTIKDIADEIKIFETLSHPSLVKYYGVEVHREEMLIFMEFCAEGTIEEVAKQGLPEVLIRLYTSQILTAVNHLHEIGIVHRDIKGANIFLTANGPVKLGDFGCAIKLKNHTTMPGEVNSLVGTTAFMAPEVIQNTREGSGRASDIWSLGCVVIEMSTGKRPWHELANNFAIMYKVGTGGCPQIPATLSEEGKDFLSHCLVQDPIMRWTTSQLQDHPFVKVSTEDEADEDKET